MESKYKMEGEYIMEEDDIFKNINGLPSKLYRPHISGEFDFYSGKNKNHENNFIIEVDGSAYYNCLDPKSKTDCHRYYLELKITNVKNDNTLVVLMLNPSNTSPAEGDEKAKIDETVKNAVRVAYKAGYSAVIIINTFSYIDGNSSTAVKSAKEDQKNINREIIKNVLEKNKELLIAWGGKVLKKDKSKILKEISQKYKNLKIYAYDWSYKSNNPYHLSSKVNNKITKFLTNKTGENKLLPLKITNKNEKYYLELVSQNSK